MNEDYNTLLLKFNKLSSFVRNEGGPPQTLGLRTKDEFGITIITIKSNDDADLYCDINNKNNDIRNNIKVQLATNYKQFAFDNLTGIIVSAIDLNSNLMTLDKIKIL